MDSDQSARKAGFFSHQRRGYHHGRLKDALVEAARSLLTERGPGGFTLAEAAKLGFKSFVLPETNMKKGARRQGIELRGVGTIGAGIDGVLVVSTYDALSEKGGIVTHHRIGDAAGMVEEIESHIDTPHKNTYTGLQVMRRSLKRGKRGTETDIIAVLGLVVDLDGDTGKTGNMPIEPNMALDVIFRGMRTLFEG